MHCPDVPTGNFKRLWQPRQVIDHLKEPNTTEPSKVVTSLYPRGRGTIYINAHHTTHPKRVKKEARLFKTLHLGISLKQLLEARKQELRPKQE